MWKIISLSLSLHLSHFLVNYVSIWIVIVLGMVAVEEGQGLGIILYMFGGFTFKISSTKMYSSWFIMCSKVPEDRPAMFSVLSMLTNEEAILPQPKQPGFFIERSSSNADTKSRNEESCTENTLSLC